MRKGPRVLEVVCDQHDGGALRGGTPDHAVQDRQPMAVQGYGRFVQGKDRRAPGQHGGQGQQALVGRGKFCRMPAGEVIQADGGEGLRDSPLDC